MRFVIVVSTDLGADRQLTSKKFDPLPRALIQPYAPFMHLENLLGNGQAEATTTLSLGLYRPELVLLFVPKLIAHVIHHSLSAVSAVSCRFGQR